MKQFIKNVLFATAACIIVIVITGSFLNAQYLKFSAVYQLLGINTMIYLLYNMISKVNFKYWFSQIFLEITVLLTIILISRYLFKWYEYFSIPLIIIITILIYIIARVLDNTYLSQSTGDINMQIKINKEKRNYDEKRI